MKKIIANFTKKQLIILSVSLVIIITSFSYAFFVAEETNNQSFGDIVVTGNMAVEYDEGPQVTAKNGMYPGDSFEKSFTVKNIGNVDAYFNIYLNNVVNTFNTKSDLVYELISEDGTNISETICPSSDGPIAVGVDIGVGQTQHYTLRISFKETNVSQDDNRNATFSAVLNLGEFFGDNPYSTPEENYSLEVGDEVTLGNEKFYVLSTDENDTVLIAKYNLHVGATYSQVALGEYVLNSNIDSSTDSGLQRNGTSGVVPFASTNYWDGDQWRWENNGGNQVHSGTAGLVSPYNSTGSYSGTPYPYVYNSSLSSTSPAIYNKNNVDSDQISYVGSNGYTIAYYVERYKTRLINNGAPNNITSRLLAYEEALNLGCTSSSCSGAPSWLSDTTYWLGSAKDASSVYIINSNGTIEYGMVRGDITFSVYGVRPVIEVNTSDLRVVSNQSSL